MALRPLASDLINRRRSSLETAVQPKEAKEFEGFTQTRTLTCRVNGA